ncbi:MAG: DALR anticodon-binding domain-containing protein, partial [Haliea sp.]
RPLDIQRRVHAVHAFSQLPEAAALAAANKRVSNILDKLDADFEFGEVDARLLQDPAEQALATRMTELATVSSGHLQHGAYAEALSCLAELQAPVDAFFEHVMVNTEDDALRSNRLNLLYTLRQTFLQVADISQLVVAR